MVVAKQKQVKGPPMAWQFNCHAMCKSVIWYHLFFAEIVIVFNTQGTFLQMFNHIQYKYACFKIALYAGAWFWPTGAYYSIKVSWSELRWNNPGKSGPKGTCYISMNTRGSSDSRPFWKISNMLAYIHNCGTHQCIFVQLVITNI